MKYSVLENADGITLVESEVVPSMYREITQEQYEQYLLQIASSEVYVNSKVEDKKADFRAYRQKALKAFDIYKVNIQYGLSTETEEQHDLLVDWYDTMLEFPENITAETWETIVFPEIPAVIQNYM